jgi:hypothetical protein
MACVLQNGSHCLYFSARNTKNPCSLPVFNSPAQALRFRNEVIRGADTRSFVWTVSKCNNTDEVSFHTLYKQGYNKIDDIQCTPFDPSDPLVDELITRHIDCLVVDSFYVNGNYLTIDGSLWTY